MLVLRFRILFVCSVLVTILIAITSACSNQRTPPPLVPQTNVTNTQLAVATDISPTATVQPPRELRVCIGSEPNSLFIYGDSSLSARNIYQAIYDGPFDVNNYTIDPVILKEIPNLAAGNAYLEPVDVAEGDYLVDTDQNLTTLKDGVQYRPSGCREISCSETYSGEGIVQIDQLVVQFELMDGLKWSDGEPLTVDDSVYSFEVAKALYPRVMPELILRTDTYQALDETRVEWRGVPGFMDPDYRLNFFSPLPHHAWSTFEPQELFTAEISSRSPLGWGAYTIDEWKPGDRIILKKNSFYFRSNEQLPSFDILNYIFVQDPEQALQDLLSGDCDIIDSSLANSLDMTNMHELDVSNDISLISVNGSAWEHIDFGIESLDPELPPLFLSSQVRQALTMCIDRQRIAETLFGESAEILDSFVTPENPYYSSEINKYEFDPQTGADLLQEIGWIDHDEDPATPRVAFGVADVADNTPFAFQYLTTGEQPKEVVAKIVQDSLAECGVHVDIISQPGETLFAPGPEGQVFGRRFAMAQYAWAGSLEPACFLYMSDEIPGPYPDYPKGWGGANASGYNNPEYDQACMQAITTLPDWGEHQHAYEDTQVIYNTELPSIPLFVYPINIATRPDMCGVQFDSSSLNELWNVESFDYGEENCRR